MKVRHKKSISPSDSVGRLLHALLYVTAYGLGLYIFFGTEILRNQNSTTSTCFFASLGLDTFVDALALVVKFGCGFSPSTYAKSLGLRHIFYNISKSLVGGAVLGLGIASLTVREPFALDILSVYTVTSLALAIVQLLPLVQMMALLVANRCLTSATKPGSAHISYCAPDGPNTPYSPYTAADAQDPLYCFTGTPVAPYRAAHTEMC